jgi:hypothetical protein
MLNNGLTLMDTNICAYDANEISAFIRVHPWFKNFCHFAQALTEKELLIPMQEVLFPGSAGILPANSFLMKSFLRARCPRSQACQDFCTGIIIAH